MAGSAATDGLLFTARKVLRYTRLYGPERTYMKVRSQAHLRARKTFTTRYENPRCADPAAPGRRVAVVGCGNFAFSTLAYYLHKADPAFLRATYDADPTRSRSLCEAYGGAYAAADLDELLADDRIDLVYIASNHATHAPYAAAFVRAGKAVHIEKPHAVTDEQLADLGAAMQSRPDVPVYLGFNRPRSSHHQALARAAGGQSGPFMLDWFIAGHHIPDDHWYFSDAEGGRVLGNLCHWLDHSLQTVDDGFFPCTIIPSSRPTSRSDFALTIDCDDGSLVSISFSAKGHTFEGVREVLSLHRGDALVLLRDFEETRVQVGPSSKVHRTLFRDHGHRANVLNSFTGTRPPAPGCGEPLQYVMDTGRVSLAAKRALESGETVRLDAWAPAGARAVSGASA